MSLFPSPDYRLLCEAAGAQYIGVEHGCVVFVDPQDGYQMKLWTSWCKSPADVAAALKAHREFVKDFPAWEPIEK